MKCICDWVWEFVSFIRMVEISAIERGTFTLIRYLMTWYYTVPRLAWKDTHNKCHTKIINSMHIQILAICIYIHVSFHIGIKSSKLNFQSIAVFNRQLKLVISYKKRLSNIFLTENYIDTINSTSVKQRNGLIEGNGLFKVFLCMKESNSAKAFPRKLLYL